MTRKCTLCFNLSASRRRTTYFITAMQDFPWLSTGLSGKLSQHACTYIFCQCWQVRLSYPEGKWTVIKKEKGRSPHMSKHTQIVLFPTLQRWLRESCCTITEPLNVQCASKENAKLHWISKNWHGVIFLVLFSHSTITWSFSAIS